jgi:hypothetical protein
MGSWLEQETNLMLCATHKSLQKMSFSDPSILRRLWIESRQPYPFALEVVLNDTGHFCIMEQGVLVSDRETGAALLFELAGVMLRIAGELSWRPVQMVTKIKKVMKNIFKPYIVYLGTDEPPRGFVFPLSYDFRDPFTSRILKPRDRPVFLLEELQPEDWFPKRLYARDTVQRMPRVGWNGDPTAIAGVDLEASVLSQ